MNIKLFSLIQIISFILLFNFSISETVVPLNQEEYSFKSTQKTEVIRFSEKNNLKNYLRIKVTGEETTTVPHIIEFVNGENRIQLSQNPKKVNYMWLTKGQLEEGTNAIITCPEDFCQYNVEIRQTEVINLDLNSEYTYYVSKSNKVMEFNFALEYPPTTQNLYASVWAIGEKEKSVQITPEGSIIGKKEEEKMKNLYNIKINSAFKVTIYADEGDLISIGSRLIENSISNTGISLNSPEIFGILKNLTDQNKACYKLDTSGFDFSSDDIVYISVKIFNDIGEVYYSGSNGEEITTSKHLITTGNSNNRMSAQHVKDYLFCIRIPTTDKDYFDANEVLYGLRMTYSKNQKYSSLLYKPQRLGEFYPRIIHGGNLVFFTGMPPEDPNTKTVEYNMITTLGFPDMFFDLCTTYPLCLYTKEKIKNITDPHNVNSMSSYSATYDQTITPISAKQNVLIVNCTEGASKAGINKQDQSEINQKTCEFNTLIYSNLRKIKLIENELFSRYIVAQETDKYTISLKYHKNLYKVYVDLMIYSGDVTFKTEADSEEKHKYQSANKIYYSLKIKEIGKDTVDFEVYAQKNSFYSIQYTLVKSLEQDSSLINNVPTGVNYLVTIDPFAESDTLIPRKKILNFENTRTTDGHPYLINFNSLNCKIGIYKKYTNGSSVVEEIIKSKDYKTSQDIIGTKDARYSEGEYQYIAKIIEMERGTYTKKICMLYASSIELEKEGKSVERQILVSENVAQKVIFEKEENTFKNKIMKYLYVIPNKANHLGIKFILLDKAKYKVTFYCDRSKIRDINVSSNQLETIAPRDYSDYCKDKQPCPLVAEVELTDSSLSKSNPSLEITIKSIGNTEVYPSYLIKDTINNDYLGFIGKNYYYTDLGNSISGEVIINYHRGNGMIYGKIVKKNQKEADNKPEWRGIYEFPKGITGTLRYTSYLRRLYFTSEDTSYCSEGCYLLLCVENKVISGINASSRFFSFDILVQTNPTKYSEQLPIISIPVENYIIGNISPDEDDNTSKPYYIFYVPYDANEIVFDFQSEYASFYVNLYINDDYLQPNKKYNHWAFEPLHKQNLYTIPKYNILELAKQEEIIPKESNSIEGLAFIIGVSAEHTDNIFTTIYSFNVHLPYNDNLNIYDIYSDHQTLCNTTKITENDKFRCLFMVRYENSESMYNLLIHPTFLDQTVDFSLYAKFVDEEIYDLYNVQKLTNEIPSKNSYSFSNEDTKEDFLFINLNYDKKKYVYVSVEVNKNTTVKLLTTFSTYDYTSSPNPSTPQLYIIERENITFSFNPKDTLMINLVSLRGSADIYWVDKNDKNIITHRLRGRDDRLSITSPPSRAEMTDYNTLVIKNLNPSQHLKSDSPEGFLFYMTFYLRSQIVNFDELYLGKSFNLNYQETELPLTIYSKLDNIHKDTNAFVTIYTLEDDSGDKRDELVLQVYAWILRGSSIYDIKKNQILSPKTEDAIKGVYDPSKRVCLVSLKKEDLEKYKIQENEKPNLVIQISYPYQSGNIYKQLSIEGTVIQDDSLIPITEKVYQHGKLKKGTEKIVYKLRTDKTQSIESIIFSSNSDKLDFTVSKDESGKDKINYDNKRDSNGRTIVQFKTEPLKYSYIYLTIHQKDNQKVTNDNLTNYVFKYINVNDTSFIFDYQVKSTEIAYSTQETSHIIRIEPITCKSCKVKYFVNFISRNSLVEGETFTNIAVVESKGLVKEFGNPTSDSDGKLTLESNGIKTDFAYIQVIAHISEGPINEYIAYNPKFFEQKKSSSTDNTKLGSNKYAIALIIVGSLLLLIIIALVIVILKFNMTNKDLMAKVQATSFQEERENNRENLIVSDSNDLK